MDEFKETINQKEQIETLETIEKEAESLIDTDNKPIAGEESYFELNEDITNLKNAEDEGNITSIPVLLYNIKTFLARFDKIDKIEHFTEFDIQHLLIKYIQMVENPDIQIFALEIITLLCEKAPDTIFISLIDAELQQTLAHLMEIELFKSKYYVFTAYGFIINRDQTYAKELLSNVDFTMINDAAVECQSLQKNDGVNFFYFKLTKSDFFPIDYLSEFIGMFFISLIKKIGVRYTLASIDTLILKKLINPDILIESFILDRILSIISSFDDIINSMYAVKILGHLSEIFEFTIDFDFTSLLNNMVQLDDSWPIQVFCTAMAQIALHCSDNLISIILENDIFNLLASLQERSFENMLYSIYFISSLVVRIPTNSLLSLVTPDFLNSLFPGISSDNNEIVFSVLSAIWRIMNTPELSFVVQQSEIQDNVEDIENLDQNEKLETISSQILEKLPEFFE
ncbi:hypothetical protein TVAG_176190 [Trichomonas vaginalis G3]|uniref:Uncharacterized protein n=1 Tax=Trichomonas vaginalis (strain ATCC PRA-98 / G3) TaxID=412133 RepID=A2GD35_TRIV3|nr:armadillo (ARM) repeat-containing protein family [Trichomonas vaginalis G3]EAX84931.1 hypothetical protein TVAG_176190 [Trichomonas vaginalis G3]KAI5530779.1 armadillo (ARM) repeat-containing protein family [Trichomonas vaginalis G3]|eukprot:XP_001297861.1 hypothetical protein [Trichomonas vaginalis G3]